MFVTRHGEGVGGRIKRRNLKKEKGVMAVVRFGIQCFNVVNVAFAEALLDGKEETHACTRTHRQCRVCRGKRN